jgi:hypothetical protein
MSPSSIGSYAQAAEAGPPPKREATQSISDRAAEEEKAKRVKSDSGEDRGRKLDIQA